MIHVILGLITVVLGSWILSRHWWAFLDLLRVLFPFLLVCLGATMILAGLKGKTKVEKKGGKK